MLPEHSALQELANVGAGHAATALSQMFSSRVDLTPPTVRVLDTASAVEFLGPTSEEVSVAMLRADGDLSGLVVFLTHDTAGMVAGLDVDTGIAADVISELGNIVAAKLFDAIATMTNMVSRATPPLAGVASRSSVVEMILALTAQSEPFVIVGSDLAVGDAIVASLIFCPDHASLSKIEALA